MKTRMIFIAISILLNIQVFASVPTVEGLLRNPSNSDVTGNLVVLRLKISSMNSPVVDENKMSTETGLQSDYYVKYLFGLDNKYSVPTVQVVYSNKEMNDDSILSVKYIKDLGDIKDQKEKKLFQSILSSLALNRSNELSQYLKSISKDYKTNKEVINFEKKNLIKSYKSYLSKKKGDDTEGLVNPLKGETSADKENINRIMATPFFDQTDAIKLVRKDSEFIWQVTLDNFQGEFENESLRMRKLEFNNLSSIDVISFDNYILFDGVHDFPKIFKANLDGYKYEVRASSIRHLDSKTKTISTRYNDYLKKLSDLKLENRKLEHPLL